MDVVEFRGLYASNGTAKALFDAVANGRFIKSLTIDLAHAMVETDGFVAHRRVLIDVLKGLERCDCGEFIKGSRGHLSRFIWSENPQAVIRTLSGQAGVEELDAEPEEPLPVEEESATKGSAVSVITFRINVAVDKTMSFGGPLRFSNTCVW